MGNLTHSYQVGYRGLARIHDIIEETVNGVKTQKIDTDSYINMLCTGGSISVAQDPIMSGGVWGAGELNISPVAYAWNYLTLDGSMNLELTNADGYWGKVYGGGAYTLFPEGRSGFQGIAYRTTTSVEASEGSALTSSINFKDTGGGFTINTTEMTDNEKNYGASYTGTKLGIAGDSLVPYWRTKIVNGCSNPTSKAVTSSDSNATQFSDVISWSVSSNRDVQFLKCCRDETLSPIDADYVVMGEITGDCSMTVFGIYGLTARSFHQQYKDLVFAINFGKLQEGQTNATYGVKYGGVKVPYALRNSGSTSMSTGSSYISTEYSYNAIGNTLTAGVGFF